jgi:CMP-N-acetylneuraminic acid synthetase
VRTLALVPARGGSKRVPRKNLELLGGKTLVRRALETSLAAGCFDVVALSSEDDAILAEAEGLPVAVVRRPDELASDTARAFAAVSHALGELEADGRFDAVAVVQATSPFTAPEDLAGAVELLRSSGAASVVSVTRLESAIHPLKLKQLQPDGRLLPYLADDALTPSHDLPPLWVRNGSIYVSRREVLDGGSLVDDADTRGYEMPPERSRDVDTPADLAFARYLVERGLQ